MRANREVRRARKRDRSIDVWRPDNRFAGATVCVVGGGPSLKPLIEGDQLAPLADKAKWIAVNNAYKICPWADVLHFADNQWWKWNGETVLATWPEDRLITTTSNDPQFDKHPRVKRLLRTHGSQFDDQRTRLFGQDSGTHAVNLAQVLGAAKIVCLGLDMRFGDAGASHWHKPHPKPSLESRYRNIFAPKFTTLVKALRRKGVEVVSATAPGVPEIQYQPLAAALGLEPQITKR